MKTNKTYLICFSVLVLIIGIILSKWLNKNKVSNKSEYLNEYNFITNMKEKLYIAIDFGNYKSSYAYYFHNNKDKIILGKMRSIPSLIILNKTNESGKNFGTKSINSISNYDEEEMKQLIYMDNLKLKFSNISNDDFISSYNDIISKSIIEYLKLFSDEILKEINSLGIKYSKGEINWIITAPKIWNDYTKINLLNFAKIAGMKNIELGLESEVAALSVFRDSIISSNLKKNGKIFLLVDLGDYKIDISLNEIVDNDKIKQLIPPLGGNFGSMNINDNLMEVIQNVIGNETIEKAKEKQFDEYLLTKRGVEEIKKKYRENQKNYFEVYAKFERKNTFFENIKKNAINFCNLFKKEKIMREIKYGNFSIKFDEYKVLLPGELIEKIIKKRVEDIISYIKSILTNIKKYDYIILTGGFANNDILIKEFRKNFKNVHILYNQEYSVLEGALIYLNDMHKIYSSVLNTTYGLGIIKNNHGNYEEKIEILVKKGDIINSTYYFNKIIELNSNIRRYLCINFYKSDESHKLTQNNYFGTIEISLKKYIDIQNKDISLEINIYFIPYFKIEVIDKVSKERLKFSFMKKNNQSYFLP